MALGTWSSRHVGGEHSVSLDPFPPHHLNEPGGLFPSPSSRQSQDLEVPETSEAVAVAASGTLLASLINAFIAIRPTPFLIVNSILPSRSRKSSSPIRRKHIPSSTTSTTIPITTYLPPRPQLRLLTHMPTAATISNASPTTSTPPPSTARSTPAATSASACPSSSASISTRPVACCRRACQRLLQRGMRKSGVRSGCSAGRGRCMMLGRNECAEHAEHVDG